MDASKVFAQRVLYLPSRRLIVQISKPVRRRRETEFYCSVEITSNPGKTEYHKPMIGYDSWQSLELAMALAQTIVEVDFPDAYAFEPGDGPGFPLTIGQGIPYEYFKRLRAHLLDEYERLARKLFREAKRKQQKAKTTKTIRRGKTSGHKIENRKTENATGEFKSEAQHP